MGLAPGGVSKGGSGGFPHPPRSVYWLSKPSPDEAHTLCRELPS